MKQPRISVVKELTVICDAVATHCDEQRVVVKGDAAGAGARAWNRRASRRRQLPPLPCQGTARALPCRAKHMHKVVHEDRRARVVGAAKAQRGPPDESDDCAVTRGRGRGRRDARPQRTCVACWHSWSDQRRKEKRRQSGARPHDVRGACRRTPGAGGTRARSGVTDPGVARARTRGAGRVC